ncbi:MAG: pseudouridine synthase [Deltaproteobacteria bacterium]|nr:pseudouridine synthase [Deltaproteobacteria bacterium]
MPAESAPDDEDAGEDELTTTKTTKTTMSTTTKTTTRLVVYLARAGAASRRGAGDLVKDGRVRVNGQVVTNPALGIDEAKDFVKVDGKKIARPAPPVFVAFHKPRGVVTTRSDPEGRPTVSDYLKRVKAPVQAVGRLDHETQGLVILTNDGVLANRLMRPETKVPRVYEALVTGCPNRETLAKLAQGVVIDGRRTRPAKVRILENAARTPSCNSRSWRDETGRSAKWPSRSAIPSKSFAASRSGPSNWTISRRADSVFSTSAKSKNSAARSRRDPSPGSCRRSRRGRPRRGSLRNPARRSSPRHQRARFARRVSASGHDGPSPAKRSAPTPTSTR